MFGRVTLSLLAACTVILALSTALLARQNAMLGERVAVLEGRMADRDSAPIAVAGRDGGPSIRFADEEALADYAVETRDRLDGLLDAIEKDIHSKPILGKHAMINTHQFIDQRTWQAEELTIQEIIARERGPYLTYTNNRRP